jgi:hypothetical protein
MSSMPTSSAKMTPIPSTTTSATGDFEASSSSQYEDQATAHNAKQDKMMGLPDLQQQSSTTPTNT